MAKKATLTARAWNVLRLALFSSHKGGGIFKGRSMVDMVSSYFKRSRTNGHDRNPYREREFSFNETPMFHLKSQKSSSARFQHLPHIPCINPPVDFGEGDGGDGVYGGNCETRCVGRGAAEEDGGCMIEMGVDCLEVEVAGWNEEEIDSKAEEFIARFYEQIRLQRQSSNMQIST